MSADAAVREPRFLLAPFERRALPWLARRLPRRVLPDHLTALGVAAALGIAAAYVLSNESPAWLWVASALLVVHWLGDSLDGTLARVRRIERPRYGYYLDHLTDAFSTVAIGVGLGLSPFMLLASGLAIAIGYLLLSVNVYLEAHVLQRFRIGHAYVGPTEARVALIGLNSAIALGLAPRVELAGLGLGALDLVALGVAVAMTAVLGGRAVSNLRELARAEPSARAAAGGAR